MLPENRPCMSSVIFMLANMGASTPEPRHPGFFDESSADDKKEKLHSKNPVIITTLEGMAAMVQKKTTGIDRFMFQGFVCSLRSIPLHSCGTIVRPSMLSIALSVFHSMPEEEQNI
ncbi:hypothetical protein EZV62_008484 [Acer yangbiense]|uniref:S-locus receptor kinase C-terminal domain-containing protein n=1 Tax=Acer yangbiense TaxID=1000413 RepID=A0A5C7IE40_9ROSI|nr:hypothetical protein EZV62_008484 [Acer yangbiense]